MVLAAEVDLEVAVLVVASEAEASEVVVPLGVGRSAKYATKYREPHL